MGRPSAMPETGISTARRTTTGRAFRDIVNIVRTASLRASGRYCNRYDKKNCYPETFCSCYIIY
jgi:hypothetical protein